MAETTWKQSVLKALKQASKEVAVTRIAREIEVPRQRLYDFLKKGYLATDDVKNLSDWLIDRGYLRGREVNQEVRVVSDPLERAMHLLQNLCSELKNDETKRIAKVGLMRSTLTYVLDEVVPQVEKQSKRKK